MTVEYLGDVHLGKSFQTGVPLHRRGDREAMQWAQFEGNLLNTKSSHHIQVGDIFDKMIVPYSVVYRAAMAYRAAVEKNADTTYVVLRGNHDASRDADRVSAFQLFAELVRSYGVIVVDEEPLTIVIKPESCGKTIAQPYPLASAFTFFPWHPFKTAAEMVDAHPNGTADTAVGHWDVVLGQDNQIPAVDLLSKGFTQAVTGHDHNKRDLVMDGLPVHVTGSMQPYSHGEDAEGILYVTRTLQEALVGDFKDKCLRVILGPDEVLDQAIDCLQLTMQREKADGVDLGEVDFEEFNLKDLFHQAREEVGLDEEFGALVLSKLEEERAVHS